MINHSRWEYENQDYLKEHYEKRMLGKDTHLHVRRFRCKGCGRVFYTTIRTKKYCLYSLCGNHGYQKELKWRREQKRKDRICQTCGNTFTPKPLPENYHSAYQRWKAGKITGTAEAKECGMPLATFRYRAEIYEKAKIL